MSVCIKNLTAMNIRHEPKHKDKHLGSFFAEHIYTGHGAEIGVCHGANARNLLRDWPGKRLWLIDPWILQNADVYRERQDDKPYHTWYHEVCQLSIDDPRAVPIRLTSAEAAKLIPDLSLDFAYIDGNHAYDYVIDDLYAWERKIHRGGLLCGHDFCTAVGEGHYCEVEQAVTDWAFKNGKDTTIELWDCCSWFIRKDWD